jgi:hypothetical protein
VFKHYKEALGNYFKICCVLPLHGNLDKLEALKRDVLHRPTGIIPEDCAYQIFSRIPPRRGKSAKAGKSGITEARFLSRLI